MSFVFYDISFLVIFSLAIALFLYIKRKNLKREGLMFLYRTSIGLKIIEFFGTRNKKVLKFLSYIIVLCGYFLMVFSLYFLFQILYFFTKPEFVKLVKVPPIMPLIPYLPDLFKVSWLPPFYFTYWIIAIALVAIFHEGFHGIFARFYKVKIKSTGFGFLGPFLAFFVEQDDRQMKKKKIFPQLAILSSGVFANILLSIVFFFFLALFFTATYSASGVVFMDYSYTPFTVENIMGAEIINETFKVNDVNFYEIYLDGKNYLIYDGFFNSSNNLDSNSLIKAYHKEPALINGLSGIIVSIDNVKINSKKDLENALSSKKPGENIGIATKNIENKTENRFYQINLGQDYDNSSRAVLGIAFMQTSTRGFKGFIYKIISTFKEEGIYYEPTANQELTIFIYNLIWWIFIINLSVAVANMLPLGIFDGGRFFYLTILAITKSKKIAEKSFKAITWALLAVLALMMVFWFFGIS